MDETPQPPVDPFSAPPQPPTTPVLRPLGAAPVTGATPVIDGGATADAASPTPFPFLAPGATAVTDVRVEPDDPKRRKKGLLLGVGVGILAIVAVVVAVLLIGSGKDADAYSLQAASTAAKDADKVAFTMHMEAAGLSIDMDARIDMVAQLMAISADMPALTGDGGTVSMIMDLGAKRMYMDASSMPGGDEAPTKWISLDLSNVPGLDEQLGSLTGSNPLDAATLFDGASKVEDLGLEDLDGEQVKHYQVTVSVDDLKAAQPGVFDQLGDAVGELPSTIDYDVWITKDNQMRKLAFSMPVLGQSLTLEMLVTAVGEIDPIVLPADDEVTDMTDLMAGGA